MKSKIAKKRLDLLLVERRLADTRTKAQAVILAGEILVNQQKITKAGALVPADAAIVKISDALPYASRAGLKLAGALDDFAVDVKGRVCLDVGSSTGGFTDCLLQRGAQRVYAVDVNTAQLEWKLQRDPRVVKLKKNARDLQPADLPEAVDLVTVDLSFISTAKVLPAIVPLARPGADFLILVKPQFELERRDVGKGGIIRDPELHQRAIDRVSSAATSLGLRVLGSKPSRLAGAEGNLEFFIHARKSL